MKVLCFYFFGSLKRLPLIFHCLLSPPLIFTKQPIPVSAIAHLLPFAAIPSLVAVGLGFDVLVGGLDMVEPATLVVVGRSLLVAIQ